MGGQLHDAFKDLEKLWFQDRAKSKAIGRLNFISWLTMT